MFDTEAIALLHPVLDEVCESVSHREIGGMAPEAIDRNLVSGAGLHDLRSGQVGRDALSHAPMWR
ncbi:hypothetical protein BSZ21_20680 [Bradyrhizobium canariense]|uniref:hypothetical protein n=1 Tax=Bradyrhizobium canariense TaxID=255045 RepID=UPI000A195197|nr:hypothetical protein [Bradyrhizobium canariense]OSI65554.1 hypothetical protein BSZ21_20680 [Bradyrhizobium canariense]